MAYTALNLHILAWSCIGPPAIWRTNTTRCNRMKELSNKSSFQIFPNRSLSNIEQPSQFGGAHDTAAAGWVWGNNSLNILVFSIDLFYIII